MDFQFYMPVRVYAEENAIERHREQFGQRGKRCLIVTGAASAKKSGALEDVTAALTAEGVAWELFDRVGQNPLVSVCHAAGAAAGAFGAEFLVGIGGGSPLDATKAAAVFAANPSLAPMDIFSGGWSTPALPFLLVGTTAGTGSEVTPYSVLTVDESGQKRSWNSPDSFARAAFGDPRYTMSLPRDVTMSTGLDAVAHCLEAYFSKAADEGSDLFAIAAMKLLMPALKDVWLSEAAPTLAQRETLYRASLYAGLALNRCGTLFCHAMGYALTEEAGIPHGYACAAFLPELISLSVPLAPQKSMRLFQALGMYAEELSANIRLLTTAEFPPITDGHLEELLQGWQGSKNMERTLGTLDSDAQRHIARRVLQQRQ